MENLLFFIIVFIIVFLVNLILYFIRRKKGTLYQNKSIIFLTTKYKLKKKNLDLNRLCLITILIDSLIISITGTICTMIDLGYIWQLAIGFVMLMGLIYISYTLLGRFIKRKEGK